MREQDAALLLRGQELRSQGEPEQAEELAARHLIDDPVNAAAWQVLGAVSLGRGDAHQAEAQLSRARRVAEDPAPVLCDLSQTLHVMKRDEEAEKLARAAAVLAPDSAAAHHQLAASLLGRRPPAVILPHFKRAVACEPSYGRALYGLASMYHRMGMADDALEAVHRAMAALPQVADVLALGAHIYLDHGQLGEALAYYSQAVQCDPRASVLHSNFVMAMTYDSHRSEQQKGAAHRLWGAMHAEPLRPAELSFGNDPDPDRRLRVGFVSGDYTRHAVSYFLFPLFKALDRSKIEVFCYSNTQHTGLGTETFKGLADHWRDILGLSDEVVAQGIRADGIDILIDLSGHTSGNRLLVFALCPAPVQITWLGYPATTGMKVMDYRLTDAFADPEGVTDAYHTETLMRLPAPFLCYEPAEGLPEPATRPSDEPLTFGSFNNISKVTRAVVTVWARILRQAPESRILLKSRFFAEASTRDRYSSWFEAEGVARDRLKFIGHVDSVAGHLGCYSSVDLALDPFPYNGTTSTCEALWMGVPVLTVEGQAHAGRVGVTLLRALGLDDFVASDEDAYVARAVALAGDRPRLTALRETLRPRMAASPLCDAPGFARRFEDSLRAAWQGWCRTH